MPKRLLVPALACVTVLAGCSINVPRDYDDEWAPTSCAVTCPNKGRASASCLEPRTPACSCDPTPASSCMEPRGKR